MRIWRWEPDWRDGVTEGLSYLTDVRTVQDGREARTRVREHPRRGFSFSVVRLNQDLRELDAALWSSANPWLMPVWWDVSRATLSNAGAGIMSLSGDFTHRDWREGGQGVITDGNSWHSFEVLTLSDDTILAEPMPSSFGSRVKAWPAWPAHVRTPASGSLITAAAGELQLSAEFLEYRSPDGEPMPDQHDGLDLFLDRPNRREPIGVDYERMMSEVDFQLGRVNRYDEAQRPFMARSAVYTDISRDDIWRKRLWWQHLGGRARAFYAPTWQSDIKVMGLGFANEELQIEPVWWSQNYDGKAGRNLLYLRIRGHEPFILPITNSAPEDWHEILWGFSALPDFSPNDVIQCSWLERARLAADTIDIEWITPGIAETSLNLRILDSDL